MNVSSEPYSIIKSTKVYGITVYNVNITDIQIEIKF